MNKEKLIKELIQDGYLKTPAIVEAFKKIDRIDFVPEAAKDEAYGNYPLSIGYGQTISQPLTVAFMLELLRPKVGEKILDIGSGSGWQTALLAQIVGNPPAGGGKVFAIERIPELVEMTRKNLAKYNFVDPVRSRARAEGASPSGTAGAATSNGVEKGIVQVVEDDGSKGYEAEAPFDKIIAAAAAKEIPESWKSQIKVGGKIVTPVANSIYVLEKTGPNEFSEKQYFGFSFVPLITE